MRRTHSNISHGPCFSQAASGASQQAAAPPLPGPADPWLGPAKSALANAKIGRQFVAIKAAAQLKFTRLLNALMCVWTAWIEVYDPVLVQRIKEEAERIRAEGGHPRVPVGAKLPPAGVKWECEKSRFWALTRAPFLLRSEWTLEQAALDSLYRTKPQFVQWVHRHIHLVCSSACARPFTCHALVRTLRWKRSNAQSCHAHDIIFSAYHAHHYKADYKSGRSLLWNLPLPKH